MVEKTKPMRCVLVSNDGEFREMFLQGAAGHGLDVVLEVDRPFDEVREHHIKEIGLCRPELIVLDLDAGPEMGSRLAEHLIEANPAARLVAAGAGDSPEVLRSAIQAGADEYLPKPLTEEEFAEVIGRLERKRASAAGKSQGRLLAFHSAKGGAGATTVATNLAIQLQRMTGERTLLVDLDLDLGEVALFLGLEPRFTFVDLVNNLHRLDDGLLETFVTRHGSGLEVLPAPYRSGEARSVTSEHVRKLLRFLRERYDWVVLDTSSGLTPWSLAAYETVDEIFVVTQLDVPSVRNVQRCRHLLEPDSTKASKLRLVINRFEGNRGDIKLSDVEEALGLDTYWTLSSDYDSVVYSINSGEPLGASTSSSWAHELAGMVGKIAGIEVPEPERRSWLDRLLGRGRKRPAPPTGDRDGERKSRPLFAPPAAVGGER